MQQAIQQFRDNLLRAEELGNLARAVQQITTGAIDISDMWRAQIVLGVSALDHFVHELTRFGMIEIAKGSRPKTDAYSKFAIPIDAAEQGLAGQSHDIWLGSAVRRRHSWLSFQQPDKIADAVRLFSPVGLWEEVGKQLGIAAKDTKLRLELIVDRRNRIAHEADMDPANPGFRWPIAEADAVDSLAYLRRVGEALFNVTV